MKRPVHALSLWIVADTVYVEFPGPNISHQITFKLHELNVAAFRKILAQRATATDYRISMPGTPNQWDFKQQLKAIASTRPTAQQLDLENLLDD